MRKAKYLLMLILIALTITPTLAEQIYFYRESDAHNHCPANQVVWLNTKTGIYHFRGQRWYGMTKNGAYICHNDADREGDRGTLNGQ